MTNREILAIAMTQSAIDCNLNEALLLYGQKICFMAEYFLPDINKLEEKPCAYECRILDQKDFADLYVPEWSNALCENRKHLDVLGVGAYDNGKLIALAAKPVSFVDNINKRDS